MSSLDIDIEVTRDEPSNTKLSQVSDFNVAEEIDFFSGRLLPWASAVESLLDEPLWAIVLVVLNTHQSVGQVAEVWVCARADADAQADVDGEDGTGDWCFQSGHGSVHDYGGVNSASQGADQSGFNFKFARSWVIDWLKRRERQYLRKQSFNSMIFIHNLLGSYRIDMHVVDLSTETTSAEIASAVGERPPLVGLGAHHNGKNNDANNVFKHFYRIFFLYSLLRVCYFSFYYFD